MFLEKLTQHGVDWGYTGDDVDYVIRQVIQPQADAIRESKVYKDFHNQVTSSFTGPNPDHFEVGSIRLYLVLYSPRETFLGKLSSIVFRITEFLKEVWYGRSFRYGALGEIEDIVRQKYTVSGTILTENDNKRVQQECEAILRQMFENYLSPNPA